MPQCAVNVCKITTQEAKNSDICISFHTFPKESSKRSKWVKFCGLIKDPGTSLYVCSQHFTSDDFVFNASIRKSLTGAHRNSLVRGGKISLSSTKKRNANYSFSLHSYSGIVMR